MRAAALSAALLVWLSGCGGSGTFSSARRGFGRAPSAKKADRLATDAAYAFLDTYTTDGGRIQRTDQGGDTVGEGQAYGMLAAAAVGDPQRFDRIWGWTQANMLRPDGLLVFRWADGRVVDPQAAADADLDAARALLVASCRFRRDDLRTAAERIGRAVLAHETATAGGRLVLLAGPWADHGGTLTVNPSYLDPTTLQALERVTGDQRFAKLAGDGRDMISAIAHPLAPDWAVVDAATGDARPVSAAGSTSGPGRFSFDAVRTLVRLGADPDVAGRSIAARAWPVFRDRDPSRIPVVHELDGSPAGDPAGPAGPVAAAGAATAAGDRAAAARLLDAAQAADKQRPSYYGSALVALGRLTLTTRRLQPCSA